MTELVQVSDLRQGDVLFGGLGEGSELFVIVSQTCDVVQPKREIVQVAPLISIDDETVKRAAVRRDNPRHPQVGPVGEEKFADLANIRSIRKSDMSNLRRDEGLSRVPEKQARDFGLSVGRWFSRFAFPDEIQPWLEPVQAIIRDKYLKESSALGKVLQHVTEVRVESSSWEPGNVILTLHVIVQAGSLPSLPEDVLFPGPPGNSDDLEATCRLLIQDLESGENPPRLSLLWSVFAEALAKRCRPRSKWAISEIVMGAVSSVEGEVSTDDEFPLSRYRRSEQIDVDFLSDPMPL